MGTFVDILRSFDRHERGILLRWVTGQSFNLDGQLREQLQKLLDRTIPEDAFVATDYVLDWLGAAEKIVTESDGRATAYERADGLVTGSPEDVDLLIAWEDDRRHLILVEAKGFTGWSNQQMTSKANRLKALFGALDNHQVDLHFVLVGPTEAKKLAFQDWPAWMRPDDRVHFLQLPMPEKHRVVERGQQSNGSWTRTQTDWTHWRVNEHG
ncbi:hypothetical protein [Kribbella endophytica]